VRRGSIGDSDIGSSEGDEEVEEEEEVTDEDDIIIPTHCTCQVGFNKGFPTLSISCFSCVSASRAIGLQSER
jgi:hypothetical protein